MEIGFVDFSKEERNKVLLTLRLLGTPTALDELGIGVIRDAFADILFPGISTLQTRAKYFVLIPYLFEKAAHQKLSSGRELYRWLVASEDKMVETLVKNSESGETGIIGREALKQNRTVKLKPSSIYWGGLRTFEIVRNPKITLAAACNVVGQGGRKSGRSSLLLKRIPIMIRRQDMAMLYYFLPLYLIRILKRTRALYLRAKKRSS